MQVITVSSLKGGVGKTTGSIFLGLACRAMGLKMLGIDLDHNNNFTDFHFREELTQAGEPWAEIIEQGNIRHALTGHKKIAEVIYERPYGDVIPATPSLATIGLELARDPAAVLRLRASLRRLDYDVVIIDTPPALTLELTAGLYAADLVIVPISASRWTVQGYQVIEAEVSRVEDAGIPSPRMLALPSMVTEAEAIALQAATIWTTTRTIIRRDAAIKMAASEGRELRKDTYGATWFSELAREVDTRTLVARVAG